ncbi:uncharacterized protein LOC103842872 isoform X7 [Brassica rapa]|uniref:uncharacterized protein LOC103842872 isoform X7 n=1 Tax=Brassica campestris TaxID=3711 RepID=UPI00142E0775|nr:uncharacterized protein LOC103842872 isoform X7 [Brassica rapa]
MGRLVGESELPEALLKAGKDLLEPHSSTDSLLDLLHKVETLLSNVEQDPIVAVQSALRPSTKALISADLLRNPDSDVRVYVVSCLTEIMRITAPEAPYHDDHMKDIFEVTVEAFGKLADASSRSYKKAEAVLDTVAKVRSSLVMLDLECDDVILEMFRQFLKVISPDHPQAVLHSMETIMTTVIDESEEVPMDLLEILLAAVKKENQDVSPMASKLVEKVLSSCASTLRPCIMEALKSTGTSLDMYSPVVSSICQSEAAASEAQIVVNPKETKAGEKTVEEQVVPSDSLQGKLDLGLSVKGARSKRTARGGTRANGDDKVTKGSDLHQLLKQGHSESTDTDTESGSTRRRGRKPNSLMNPEEGYSFKTSSSKNDSSRGKLAGKKASSPSKVGQTNQSVVISISPSGKSRKKGSGKRSRSKMEEHTASPVTDDPEQMVEPAVNGAKFVINAAAEAKVKRVVITSSIGAVYMDPNRDPEAVVDESCWSDLEFCKNTKNWYCYGKMVAEQAAWETAEEKGVDLVVLNPVLVLGPPLQPTINASLFHVLKYLTGSAKTYANLTQAYVDVRDVALAHVLVYEAPSASGRYLLAETALHRGEVVEILAKLFPEYPLPTKCKDEKNPRAKPYKFTNQKIKDLGLEFTSTKQSLYDTVKSLQEKGHLPPPPPPSTSEESSQNGIRIGS